MSFLSPLALRPAFQLSRSLLPARQYTIKPTQTDPATLDIITYCEKKEPDIVVIPPILCCRKIMQTAVSLIHKQGLSIAVPSMRNHGKSSHHDTMTFEDTSHDIKHLFDTENWQEPKKILGFSWGGKIAMHFNHRYPERVKELILVDITPSRYQNTELSCAINFASGLDMASFKARKPLTDLLKRAIPDENLRRLFLFNIGQNERKELFWRCNIQAIRENLPTIQENPLRNTPPSQTKTTLIRGEYSPYTPPERISALESHYPENTIITIPDAGHSPHIDNPKVFFPELLKLLQASSNA